MPALADHSVGLVVDGQGFSGVPLAEVEHDLSDVDVSYVGVQAEGGFVRLDGALELETLLFDYGLIEVQQCFESSFLDFLHGLFFMGGGLPVLQLLECLVDILGSQLRIISRYCHHS